MAGTRVTLINLIIDPRAKHALHTISAPRKSGERDRVRKLTKLLLRMICMCRCFNGPQGGAVYVASSATFTATNCKFSSNTAFWNGNNYYGGAVYVHGSFAATNCEFSSNTAVASVVMPYLDLLLCRTCIAADLIESHRR